MIARPVLQAAAQVEEQAEALYAAIAEVFAHAPILRDTFLRLAGEEHQHAVRLQMLARQGFSVTWTQATVNEIQRDVAEMGAAVQRLRDELLRRARRLDPYDTLRRLAELEEHFSGIHAERVVAGTDPRLRGVFQSMAKQDAEHRRLLTWVRSTLAA